MWRIRKIVIILYLVKSDTGFEHSHGKINISVIFWKQVHVTRNPQSNKWRTYYTVEKFWSKIQSMPTMKIWFSELTSGRSFVVNLREKFSSVQGLKPGYPALSADALTNWATQTNHWTMPEISSYYIPTTLTSAICPSWMRTPMLA